MDLSELKRQTQASVPGWSDGAVDFAVIEKGGSGRIFVRATHPDSGQSVIAMQYSDERSDNLRFASITDFLNDAGIAAPKIVGRREDLGMLWVEDLGEVDLKDLSESDWETQRRPAYESALKIVFQLHSIHEADPPEGLPELEKPFDAALYQWEQDYFINQFVGRYLSSAVADSLREVEELSLLRDSLTDLPRTLLHRDFQSTNVMVRNDDTFLIDYQGLRWGIPEYDVASMLYDPYVDFSEEEREHLIQYYFGLKQGAGDPISMSDFRRRLNQCASQRLMQALGAYGFLSEVKGKREFRKHITPAKERLLSIADLEGGLPSLKAVLV